MTKIIYKYRNWTDDFHKDVLLQNKLYLSDPDSFNDPFDCKIFKNYTLLDSEEKRKEFVELKRKAFEMSEQEARDFFARLCDIDNFQKESEEVEFESIKKHLGVLSFSARWDSILMWSHYGNFHKGYCIGFNEEKMHNCRSFGKGGFVDYDDGYPVIDPTIDYDLIDIAFLQTHRKAKEWKYEEEYRITKLSYPEKFTDAKRVVLIPDNFIEEVNLGCCISEENKNEIVEECNRRKIKIFQVDKVPFKFKLERIEL